MEKSRPGAPYRDRARERERDRESGLSTVREAAHRRPREKGAVHGTRLTFPNEQALKTGQR